MSAGVRVHWYGDRVIEVEREAALRGLELCADLFVGRVKAATPVDTGRLVASVHAEVHAGDLRLEVHAGQGLDYAAIVHEKIEIHHPDGQAKYVEQPMREAGRAAGNIIAAQLRARLR